MFIRSYQLVMQQNGSAIMGKGMHRTTLPSIYNLVRCCCVYAVVYAAPHRLRRTVDSSALRTGALASVGSSPLCVTDYRRQRRYHGCNGVVHFAFQPAEPWKFRSERMRR